MIIYLKSPAQPRISSPAHLFAIRGRQKRVTSVLKNCSGDEFGHSHASNRLSLFNSLNSIINIFLVKTCINILHFLFIFYFPFLLNKSFFKKAPAKHKTNLRSILRSQLFIKNKIYIEYKKRTRKQDLKNLINLSRIFRRRQETTLSN